MKKFDQLSKKEKIERWENVVRVLQNLTPHQKRNHWNMAEFGAKTDCGTVCCAAGHCEADPWFRRKGFRGKYFKGELVSTEKYLWRDSEYKWFGQTVYDFFGTRGSEDIFMNTSHRPVSQVIKEVNAYIKELREEA